jgi:hypothetical protein
MKFTWQKVKRKIRAIIVDQIAGTPLQFKLYPSFWHYKFGNSERTLKAEPSKEHYLTQEPNYGAGIGHQMSNWNSGLFFSQLFLVKFAHSPFSDNRWEKFLGFGEGEIAAIELRKQKKIKKVKLPKFNPTKEDEVELIGNIIHSYQMPNILFSLEVDQGYKQQCDTAEILSKKFFGAKARKEDEIIFDDDFLNIAIHIRRGDIVALKEGNSSTWKNRWLENQYYADILSSVLSLTSEKKVRVYLFSQGQISDFPEFERFENVIFCLDMDVFKSFLHLVNADLLISSKSSFSYKPALISKGVKIVPETFWHAYPNTPDYILADDNGKFNLSELEKQLKKLGKNSDI